MSLLKKTRATVKVEKDVDRLGGANILPSSVQEFTINMAYILPSDSGALGLHLKLENAVGIEYRESLWVTSGDAKGNSSTYTNDKGTFYLPGYNIANAITMLVLEAELPDAETEVKNIKVYNSKAQKELATEVEVITGLLGEKILLAIKHTVKNKQVKVGNTYVDTPDKQESNEITSVFHPESHQTLNEALDDVEAEHMDAWLAKYDGKPFDYYKEVKATGGGANKGNAVTQTASADKPSMFNRKK